VSSDIHYVHIHAHCGYITTINIPGRDALTGRVVVPAAGALLALGMLFGLARRRFRAFGAGSA
jgi:hypothetical protein